MKHVLNINKDFSHTPGSRKRKEGKFSAEEFAQEVLIPAFNAAVEDKSILTVELYRSLDTFVNLQ